MFVQFFLSHITEVMMMIDVCLTFSGDLKSYSGQEQVNVI